jgi:hypothetical protein
MLEGKSYGRPGAAGGASAYRVDYHQDSAMVRRQKAIHLCRCPGLLDSVLSKIRAHRSGEFFGICHGLILP